MARQMLKGLAMLALLLTLTLAATVMTAKGQGERLVKANVPFDFIVGDKALPSGRYAVSTIGVNKDALAIQSGEHSAVRLAGTKARRGENAAALVFHRYGQTFFLAEIRAGNEGRVLLKSNQERALEREQSRIAGNRASSYEEVVILASDR